MKTFVAYYVYVIKYEEKLRVQARNNQKNGLLQSKNPIQHPSFLKE